MSGSVQGAGDYGQRSDWHGLWPQGAPSLGVGGAPPITDGGKVIGPSNRNVDVEPQVFKNMYCVDILNKLYEPTAHTHLTGYKRV